MNIDTMTKLCEALNHLKDARDRLIDAAEYDQAAVVLTVMNRIKVTPLGAETIGGATGPDVIGHWFPTVAIGKRPNKRKRAKR